MAPAATLRTGRVEARLRPDQKLRIERAAGLRGVSISDFMIQNADEAAIKMIQQHESWELQLHDRNLFVDALLNPKSPSTRLKKAAERYKKQTRQQ